VGESLPGWRACSRLRSEEPVPGTKKSPRRDAERRSAASVFLRRETRCGQLLPRRAFRRSVSPQCRGEKKIKAQLARRRGNEDSWLFESTKSEIFASRRNILRVIRGLDPRIHHASKRLLQRGWMRGSSPRMTISGLVSRARCGILHAASQNRDRSKQLELSSGLVAKMSQSTIFQLTSADFNKEVACTRRQRLP
jgi:hypothetical protein